KWLLDERSRKAVTTAERHADGLVGENELQVARKEAGEANDSLVGQPAYLSEAARAAFYTLIEPEFMWVGEVVLFAIRFSISDTVDGHRFSIEADTVDGCDFSLEADSEEVRTATLREYARQLCLLRDIFGNPFRPLASIAPTVLAWKGGTVRRLAQA